MKKLLLLLPVILILSSCGSDLNISDPGSANRSFFSMDTYMSITVYGEGAGTAAGIAESEIFSLESKLSRTIPDSDISRINSSATASCEVSDATAYLIGLAKEYSAITDGAFDITIGAVMDAWGFGKTDSATYRVPSADELDSLLVYVGSDMIRLEGNTVTLANEGMVLDLGGVGKGYAGDVAAKVLRDQGIVSALLKLGGNIYCIGTKLDGSLWRVAVQDPDWSDSYVGVLSLSDTAAVTTGGYRRFFEQDGVVYHHVLDPSTGYPADSGLTSVTIVAENSAKADILSTAIYVMGEEDASGLWRSTGGFDMVLLTADGRALVTEGLEGFFELTEGSGYQIEILEK